MAYRIFRIFAGIILLAACSKNEPPGKESGDSAQVATPMDSSLLKMDLSQAPAWFSGSVQAMADSLLAPGYGKSRRLEIAEEKAMMDAQSRLADMVSGDSSGAIQHELTQIAPFKIERKERVQRDGLWHVYVVLKKNP